MRRFLGRGRRGPSLIGTAARTAVIAGTATSVAGRVAARQAGAAPPPEPVPPAVTDDIVTQITRLGELVTAGLITDEEFAVQKARILGV